MNAPRSLLTIAGTDPSGGAGIQVDLQVFRDFGFHGLSVIAAVVWQNTVGVRGFEAVPAIHVADQLDAVLDDIPISGLKLGMLASSKTVRTLGNRLSAIDNDVPVVLDPVLASGAGQSSLRQSGMIDALRACLLPEVDWLTPNVPEAEAILGSEIAGPDQLLASAEALCDFGPEVVLLKGGHLEQGPADTVTDALAVAGRGELLAPYPRIEGDVHGTGCQLASAITALLARGYEPKAAAERGRNYLQDLLAERAFKLGKGRPIVVRVEEEKA